MHRRMNLALVSAALTMVAIGCTGEQTRESGEAQAAPDIQTREFDYQQGETALQGFIAWDDAISERRPGVLVVHEWWGHNEHARNQARRLAEAGYVGFALDMYGEGKLATHPEEAMAFMTEATADPSVPMARFNAALDQLLQDPHVDSEQIAAVGYCFGGAIVLMMARAGVDLDAVASFHGAMPPSASVDSGAVKARMLVLTGAADALVPLDQVAAFRTEMEAAGARIEVVSYPNAKHSFTNPDAGEMGMETNAYDADADRQSWAAMLAMFDAVFH